MRPLFQNRATRQKPYSEKNAVKVWQSLNSNNFTTACDICMLFVSEDSYRSVVYVNDLHLTLARLFHFVIMA